MSLRTKCNGHFISQLGAGEKLIYWTFNPYLSHSYSKMYMCSYTGPPIFAFQCLTGKVDKTNNLHSFTTVYFYGPKLDLNVPCACSILTQFYMPADKILFFIHCTIL